MHTHNCCQCFASYSSPAWEAGAAMMGTVLRGSRGEVRPHWEAFTFSILDGILVWNRLGVGGSSLLLQVLVLWEGPAVPVPPPD